MREPFKSRTSFPQPSSSPGLNGFKARYCGDSSHITSPWAKNPRWGLTLGLKGITTVLKPLLWVTAPRKWVLTRLSLLLPLILIWLFLFLSCRTVLLIFRSFSDDLFCVCSCSLMWFMGGGELRIFLLHHLSNYLGFLSLLLFKLLFQILKTFQVIWSKYLSFTNIFGNLLLVLNFFSSGLELCILDSTLRGQLWVVKLFVPLSLLLWEHSLCAAVLWLPSFGTPIVGIPAQTLWSYIGSSVPLHQSGVVDKDLAIRMMGALVIFWPSLGLNLSLRFISC